MPLEMDDADDDDPAHAAAPRFGSKFGSRRFSQPSSGAWWRPASTFGRVALGVGVLAVLGSFTVGVMAVKTYLGRDSRFRIAGAGNIEATGITEVSRAEMLPVFGEDFGRNIFFVPLGERRKQLEAIPWVEHATVMRLLPDQIRVSIVEREPVAFVRQGQQIGLVDKDGVLLTMPPSMMAQHHYSFPVVTGVEPSDPPSMRKARMAVYGRLLTELDANGQHLSEQISEIDLSDPQDARVLLPEPGADILGHFGDDRFLDRYQRYKAHIAEWRQQYPKLTAVDLRYDTQVVLEMTPGTNAVAAAVDGGAAPDAGGKPALAAAESETPSAKPFASKPAASKPAASPGPANEASSAAEPKPAAVKQGAVKKPSVKQAAVKQGPAAKPKTAAQKRAASIEAMAARQRQERARAKQKLAHEKAEHDKTHAPQQHAALKPNTARPKPTVATAEGQ
jgi:cell division protein FtsQ